jgi:hypothetical protein
MKAKKLYKKGGITPRPEIGQWLMSQPKKVKDYYNNTYENAYKRGATPYEATTTAYNAAKEFSLKKPAAKKTSKPRGSEGFPRPIFK